MITPDELSKTLKRCREKHPSSATLFFEDGSTQVVHPSAAFNNDWRGLAEYIAQGRPYKLKRDY